MKQGHPIEHLLKITRTLPGRRKLGVAEEPACSPEIAEIFAEAQRPYHHKGDTPELADIGQCDGLCYATASDRNVGMRIYRRG